MNLRAHFVSGNHKNRHRLISATKTFISLVASFAILNVKVSQAAEWPATTWITASPAEAKMSEARQAMTASQFGKQPFGSKEINRGLRG
jgi:hypothetical protein